MSFTRPHHLGQLVTAALGYSAWAIVQVGVQVVEANAILEEPGDTDNIPMALELVEFLMD